MWQVTVSDPAAQRRTEAAVTVEILASERPELPEPVPGMAMAVREVRFSGLTAEARLGGQGEFRYITFAYRAEGIESASSVRGSSSGRSGRSGGASGAGSAGSEGS